MTTKRRVRKKTQTHFEFRAKLWRYKGPAGWHFLTLPKKISKEIRKTHISSEEGWGRLKVTALLLRQKWQTAIWFDTKAQSYLLPVKSVVRKKENLVSGEILTCKLEFEADDSSSRRLFRRTR